VKIFFVSNPGSKIVVRRGGIYIVKRNKNGVEKVVVPPDVDSIIVASSKIGISSKAIRLAASRGIDIVFLDFRGYPIARVYPTIINKTVVTRIAQYNLFQKDYGVELAKEFAYLKIVNQAELLRYLAKSLRREDVREAAYQVDSVATELRLAEDTKISIDEIRQLEARAARIYWQTIASILPPELGFSGRDQEAKDIFNMALNYGYGILYNTCEKSLLIAGLDPYLGVLHTTKSGKPSLTLDFVEMFRSIAVDKPLIINVKRTKLETSGDRLDYESRKIVAKIVLDNLSHAHMYNKIGRRVQLSEIIMREAWELALSIREGKKYKGFRAVL